jgi:hypothetical protein
MLLHMWLSTFFRKPGRKPRGSKRPAPRFRPRLEALEDRCVPSTFAVTSADDNANEKGTLRYAVAQAVNGDTILITPALHGSPIVLTQGELLLNQSVTIKAVGNAPETISGGGASRVFEVTANANVTLSDLVITGGNGVANNSNSTGFDGDGGGISNFGTLTLTDCTLSGNSAFVGGGISNGGLNNASLETSAKLTLNNCTLGGNTAEIVGGGIVNHANLTVSGSTLSNNAATDDGGGIFNVFTGTITITASILSDNSAANGGGLENHGAATITSTLLSGNQATGIHGGAIWNEASATLTVTGCILSGNSSSLFGGGIDNEDGATLTIGDSTLSGNSSGFGGGVYNSFATLTVLDSIFFGNSATGDGGAIDNVAPATATVTDSIFIGNKPNNIAGGFIDGGGNTF